MTRTVTSPRKAYTHGMLWQNDIARCGIAAHIIASCNVFYYKSCYIHSWKSDIIFYNLIINCINIKDYFLCIQYCVSQKRLFTSNGNLYNEEEVICMQRLRVIELFTFTIAGIKRYDTATNLMGYGNRTVMSQ